jgi:hypothetical protein
MHDKIHEACYELLEPQKAFQLRYVVEQRCVFSLSKMKYLCCRRRLGWQLVGNDPAHTPTKQLFAGLDHLAAVEQGGASAAASAAATTTTTTTTTTTDDKSTPNRDEKLLSEAFEIGARRAFDLAAQSVAVRFFRCALNVLGLRADEPPTHSRDVWQRIVIDVVDCAIALVDLEFAQRVIGSFCLLFIIEK